MNSKRLMVGAIPQLFERLFLISWENNRDCHITMSLSLKTMEVQCRLKGTSEIMYVYVCKSLFKHGKSPVKLKLKTKTNYDCFT